MGVTETAIELADYYNVDIEKVEVAALLHDYNKEDHLNLNMINKNDINEELICNYEIWHGYITANKIENLFGINDIEIIDAIKYHSTGKENASDILKILFIADSIEPSRKYYGVKNLRKKEKKIDEHLIKVCEHKCKYLSEKKITINKNTKKMIESIKK